MADPLFRGSGVALVTPFGPDGVREGVLRELVAFHLDRGSDALVVNGSTGEAVTMTPGEQERAVAVVVEAAAGRVPVVAGVGGSATTAARDLARRAAGGGADALLLSPPPYNKPSQEGIAAHFRAVVEAAGIPAILYNVPGRTACNVLPATVERVAGEVPVAGVKEASGDLSQIADLACRVGGTIPIYSGNDDQVLPILSLGGVGVISVVANLAPAETSRMVHHFLAGKIEEARDLQLRLLPLIRALFAEPNPVPVKAGVASLGFEVGDPRLPLLPLTPEGGERLRSALRAAGLALPARA